MRQISLTWKWPTDKLVKKGKHAARSPFHKVLLHICSQEISLFSIMFPVPLTAIKLVHQYKKKFIHLKHFAALSGMCFVLPDVKRLAQEIFCSYLTICPRSNLFPARKSDFCDKKSITIQMWSLQSVMPCVSLSHHKLTPQRCWEFVWSMSS